MNELFKDVAKLVHEQGGVIGKYENPLEKQTILIRRMINEKKPPCSLTNFFSPLSFTLRSFVPIVSNILFPVEQDLSFVSCTHSFDSATFSIAKIQRKSNPSFSLIFSYLLQMIG